MNRKMLPALLLALLPTLCYADVGDLAGIALIAMGVLLATWTGLSLIVFLIARRKVSVWKRLGFASLFFISPALLIGLLVLKAYVFGDRPTEVTETTHQPLVVADITFPAGSHAKYEQTGGFFGWRSQRKLLAIRSPHPLLLGGAHIDGLWPDQSSDEVVSLEMSEAQTIEGWRCTANFAPQMRRTPSGLVLKTCQLAVPHVWRGQRLPAGTFVSRDGADWTFLPP